MRGEEGVVNLGRVIIKEYTIHWESSSTNISAFLFFLGGGMLCLAGLLYIFNKELVSFIAGLVFIGIGICIILFGKDSLIHFNPKFTGIKTRAIVIDKYKITLLHDNVPVDSVKHTDVIQIGAYWDKLNVQPIAGFWVDTKQKKRHFRLSGEDGWNEIESRRGLHLILKLQSRYGFELDKYLEKHVKKHGGVYRH